MTALATRDQNTQISPGSHIPRGASGTLLKLKISSLPANNMQTCVTTFWLASRYTQGVCKYSTSICALCAGAQVSCVHPQAQSSTTHRVDSTSLEVRLTFSHPVNLTQGPAFSRRLDHITSTSLLQLRLCEDSMIPYLLLGSTWRDEEPELPEQGVSHTFHAFLLLLFLSS